MKVLLKRILFKSSLQNKQKYNFSITLYISIQFYTLFSNILYGNTLQRNIYHLK